MLGVTHDHGHDDHAHDRRRSQTALRRMLVLVALYAAAEFAGGLASNSLALLADAGHMASDAGALALGLFAGWVARRPASARRTYGYYRAEILAALVQGAALLAIAAMLVVEAFQRLRDPAPVDGPLMLAVAAGGLLVNLVGLVALRGGAHENLNLHGAWLHVASDTLGSLGAIAAGALVRWCGPAAGPGSIR
jgi:cobalt-zinc-cadmium efflux system protein